MPLIDQLWVVDQLLGEVRFFAQLQQDVAGEATGGVHPAQNHQDAIHGDLNVVEGFAVQRSAQDVAEQVVAEAFFAALDESVC